MLAVLFLFAIEHATCESHFENEHDNNVSSRPVMNVFFESIAPEQRFTSMADDDDAVLLDFWKQTWEAAGWEPRVLTLQDAKQHPLYDSFRKELEELCLDEFGKLSLLRWLAMAATGGGWLVDYDAFPLRDFRGDHLDMLNNGELTIYEAVAPILVSGSPDAWLDTAKFLIEDVKRHGRAAEGRMSFWTDTLGLLSAWRHPNCTLHVRKDVLDGRKAFTEQALTKDDCHKRPFRGKRVVHFGHFAMLEAPISPELRLPRHRLTVAKQWLPSWIAACGNATAAARSNHNSN
jgi:hypothetical protein